MHRFDGKLDLSPGEAEKKSVDFGVLSNHSPPPTKGECLECARVTLLRLAGRWRGDTVEEQGRNEDEVHGADAGFVVGFGREY